MKRFNYLFMAGLMTLGLGACSDEVDVSGENGGELSADKVYMSFKLELPTASRSETDNTGDSNSNENPDTEVGTTAENTIADLDVVLATMDAAGKYQYVTESTDATLTGADNAYVATFESETLESQASEDVYVFVFCNYPNGTVYTDSKILNGESNAVLDVNNVEMIAKVNAFWMANASIHSKTLDDASILKKHNTPSNAYPLGEVKVERAAARFDFAQKAEVSTVGKELPVNSYVLEKLSSSDDTPVVYVQLTNMALINVSKQFHYLRQVADEVSASAPQMGYDKTKITICGDETKDANGIFNYVVDSDAEAKVSNDYLPENFLNYWTTGNTSLSSTNATAVPVEVINFGEIWNGLDDNEKTVITSLSSNDNWTPTTGDDPGYQVWRYATENTLPTVAKQKKSLSTAVLFKGYLVDKKDSGNRLDGESNVYVHNNVLYGNWEQVKTAATDANPTLKYAYDAMASKIPSYTENTDTDDTNNLSEPKKEDAADAGFTVYSPESGSTASSPKYPMYYYYINKHNTSSDNTVMGPMEFAVVRNNVYKLAVTGISKFGHPADPTGDPDPENPGDPDEDKEIYFTVSVKVLPWTVRVNNIEF